MASRPSRSPSIPIPRRNIDSVISLSFTAENSLGGLRSASASATSSLRPAPRSFTGASFSRASPQSRTFEPRIIRADSSRSVDASCIPVPSLSVPNRRASTGTHASPTTRPATRSPASNLHSPAKSFPRPSYLDHSAFRNLLQTQVLSPLSSHKSSDPIISDSEDDSSASPPPVREPMSLPSPDQALNLPTRWSEQARHSNLNLSPDGRELGYQNTTGSSERDAAARTVESVPPACGIYYYEIEIRGKSPKAHISIGFSTSDSRISRLPGREPNSWGYYGDDGRASAGDSGAPFGPTFGLGDIVGCGIDFTTNKVFYTKNGTLIGQVFDNVGRDVQLYPAIGLQHGDTIIANFGHEPFKFDIDFYVQQKKNDTWSKIMSTPLNAHSLAKLFSDSSNNVMSEDGTKATINTLVLSYLAHHGYTKTAEAFQNQNAQALKAGDPDVEMDDLPTSQTTSFGADIKLRTQVVNAVVTGDIDCALQEMQKHHPSVLEAEDNLMLIKLRCRKFVELVLENRTKERLSASLDDSDLLHEFDEDRMDVDDEESSNTLNGFCDSGKGNVDDESSPEEAILYARQTLQNDYKNDMRPEVQALLKRSFGILAYRDPLKVGSIAAEVAGQQARVALASELNQAILKSQGKPAHPSLEMLYRHTAVCIQQLGILGDGSAAFVDMPREFLDAA